MMVKIELRRTLEREQCRPTTAPRYLSSSPVRGDEVGRFDGLPLSSYTSSPLSARFPHWAVYKAIDVEEVVFPSHHYLQ